MTDEYSSTPDSDAAADVDEFPFPAYTDRDAELLNDQMYDHAQSDLDRVVFKVSSGALVFSAGFTLLSAPTSQTAACLLFIAWGFFVISLVAHLASFPFSVALFEASFERNELREHKLNAVVIVLNGASIALACLGLLALLVFAGFTLLGGGAQ